MNQGRNKVVQFKGGYFSFALGNEIALRLDKLPEKFFILNCTSKLFTEVKKLINLRKTKKTLIKFWIEQSKTYEVNDYSAAFKLLKGLIK